MGIDELSPREKLAEETANKIQAPCGCFARPDEGEGTVCLHDNVLTPWPAGIWPA